MSTNISSTTRHLKFSYISILTNLLQTDIYIYIYIYIHTYIHTYIFEKSILTVGNLIFYLPNENTTLYKEPFNSDKSIYIVKVNSNRQAKSPLKQLIHLTNPD